MGAFPFRIFLISLTISSSATPAAAVEWQQAVVAPYMDIPLVSLDIEAPSEDEKDVSYEPNIEPEIGVGIGLGDYSFQIGTSISRPEESKGKTRHFDYSGGLDREHWSIDAGMQRYEGFYVTQEDAEYDDDHIYEQDASLAKDARFVNVFVFPFSDHVNFKKTELTTAIESRAWSPVLHAGYELTTLASAESLFHGHSAAISSLDQQTTEGRFESYIGSAGLAGSMLVNKVRMVGLFLFGTGQQHRILASADTFDAGWTHTDRFALRGRMEFQRHNWLYAIRMNLDRTTLRMRKTKIASETGIIGISVATQVDRFL